MNNKIGINFVACFGEEERKPIEEYLSGIDKAQLLKISSYFLGINPEKSEYSDVMAFLHMFFSPENTEFKDAIFSNIVDFVQNGPYPLELYEIPYVKSSLYLFEYIFDKIPEDQATTKTQVEMERDIFKAYVSLNQSVITEYEEKRRAIDEARNRSLTSSEVMLANSFHNSDLINFREDKLFSCQLLRAFYYFEFLSEREECKALLEAFYKNYGVKDYKEYLRRLLGITYPVLMKDREAHTEIHLELEEHASFLDKHIIEIGEEITEVDFLTVRSKPLYKFEPNKYRVVYPLFVIEMIYNGLYFRLRAINDDLPDEHKVKKLYDLKTYEYSEQYVLSKILKEIYGKRYIQKSGKELDAILPGAPDYYVRNGKYVHLYESKDILVKKEAKQSTDYDELTEDLKLKLVENQQGKRKAVRQLVESIRKLITQEATYDVNFPVKKAQIFPILVLHYRMFNAAGFNAVINTWFKEELQLLEGDGLDITKVHDLLVIDIETLIFNKEALKSGKITIQEAIIEYERDYLKFDVTQAKASSQDELFNISQNASTPFSFFLDNKVGKLKLNRSTRELLTKAFTLFEDNENG